MSRPLLLAVNPNTSSAVSADIDALARDTLGEAAEVRTVTASLGFRYIDSRAATAVAAYAVLETVAAALAGDRIPDAIVLACFGDPGLDALTEIVDRPVVGFAEAGLRAAADLPGRFLVATRGAAWCAMLSELVQRLGIEAQVANIVAIEPGESDAVAIARELNDQATMAGAVRLVIGGAGLIRLLPAIMAASALPVIDSHREAFRKALRLTGIAAMPQRVAVARSADISGLSPPLSRLLTAKPAGVN
jgi:Asp/Glu/hydantoin racemase